LVEAVGKKVSFSKQIIASLGLFPGTRATQARAGGDPDGERLGRADAVVARALMDVGPWLDLAPSYLSEGGRIFAMLAGGEESVLREAGSARGLALHELRRFALPSGDPRAIAVFSRAV
jgi:16S rRNA (guanine527-N7)-methyltransferase